MKLFYQLFMLVFFFSLFMYLIGCFYNASVVLTKWTETSRWLVAFVISLVCIVGGAVLVFNYFDKEK
jgi:hypothetical protein